jgi:hypothetical protein
MRRLPGIYEREAPVSNWRSKTANAVSCLRGVPFDIEALTMCAIRIRESEGKEPGVIFIPDRLTVPGITTRNVPGGVEIYYRIGDDDDATWMNALAALAYLLAKRGRFEPAMSTYKLMCKLAPKIREVITELRGVNLAPVAAQRRKRRRRPGLSPDLPGGATCEATLTVTEEPKMAWVNPGMWRPPQGRDDKHVFRTARDTSPFSKRLGRFR